MAIEDDRATEADWLEGLPLPREQTELIGHSVAAADSHAVTSDSVAGG